MKFGRALAINRQETCRHTSRITIRTHGIERQICEECGHFSFVFSDDGLSEVGRDRFARPVDQLAPGDD